MEVNTPNFPSISNDYKARRIKLISLHMDPFEQESNASVTYLKRSKTTSCTLSLGYCRPSILNLIE